MNFTGRVGQASCACAAKEETRSARHSRIRFMNSSYQRGLGFLAALVVISIALVNVIAFHPGEGAADPRAEQAQPPPVRGGHDPRSATPGASCLLLPCTRA